MKKKNNLRSLAALTIEKVIMQGQSLSQVLPGAQHALPEAKDAALLQEICFGVLRTLPQLEWVIGQLMTRPLKGKQRVIHFLLMVGLYQLLFTRVPAHAAIAETVNGAVALKKEPYKGVVNGVLRQFQRQQNFFSDNITAGERGYLHPSWLLNRLKKAWPAQWEAIVSANNQRPPMWLRINRCYHSPESWLTLLRNEGYEGEIDPRYTDAVRLTTPLSVNLLPGFSEGWVTVQDASAQQSVALLAPQEGETILDLCAAPGGKTTHILEGAPSAQVTAVDVDSHRLGLVRENLHRLKMQATLICGDGRTPEKWCEDNQQFDRILLDAPCSATGVIRRHPDIKWLRRDSDIAELAKLQREILEAIWPYLKDGGVLLYATCSIMPEENSHQIAQFLSRHDDAKLQPETHHDSNVGLQYLPTAEGGDGFFYAKIVKRSQAGH
ncbi:MAG: Ribosomal RNA small subunit methyltransferase B [Candidatus Erwinia impunctatus]|nr:Ribosomal RNA small subunit methyltransferase B [Culicoides impunctatus]